MATLLDKDVTRESSVKYDNREILISITADQKITFKLKGLKSGMLSIGIEDLYKQLRGDDVEVPVKKTGSLSIKKRESIDTSPMISLYDLRTSNAVTHMELKTKVVLEGLICELIKQQIKL